MATCKGLQWHRGLFPFEDVGEGYSSPDQGIEVDPRARPLAEAHRRCCLPGALNDLGTITSYDATAVALRPRPDPRKECAMDLPLAVAPDAVPDDSTIRLQVLCAARGDRRIQLADALEHEATAIAATLGSEARVMVLCEIDDDPFPSFNPLCRPFQGVLEIQTGRSFGVDRIIGALDGLGPRLVPVAHLDLSAVAVGTVQDLVPVERAPLRYLYAMRRLAGTSHDEYIDYYFHSHSRFGPATPNIFGYTQFHVDAAASASAASVIGIAATGIDSVSELHLESLETFFAGIGDGRQGAAAAADEATFVDRENSVSFCTSAKVIHP